MNIIYRLNFPLDPLEIVRVFDHSGIKRPTTELPRIARMFAAPCLVFSAWDEEKLVGISRSLTDYAYCCYLSDLAVDKEYQGYGIGQELVQRTKALIGDEVSLILLSAPDAVSYYPQIGFELTNNAYLIKRKR
jgi:ribosomal protein S18 acetylase RimI-like enzyme